MRPGNHNMDMVRHDVIQKPLIMRDQKNPDLWSPQRVNAVGDDLERIDVETAVGFIEHGVFRLEHRELQNLLRFFSPPENPSLTEREVNDRSIPSSSIFS